MKKNVRIIKINGFRGLFLAIFIACCLIAGFVVFPALLAMNTWNYFAFKTNSFPLISFGESILLWAIIMFSFYVFHKKRVIISLNSEQELTEDEVKDVISRIKNIKEEKK